MSNINNSSSYYEKLANKEREKIDKLISIIGHLEGTVEIAIKSLDDAPNRNTLHVKTILESAIRNSNKLWDEIYK